MKPKTVIAALAVSLASILGIGTWILSNGHPVLLVIAVGLIVGLISWFGSEGLVRIGRRNGAKLVEWFSRKTTIEGSTADNEMYDNHIENLFAQIGTKELARLKKDPTFKSIVTQYHKENDGPKKERCFTDIVDYVHTRIIN